MLARSARLHALPVDGAGKRGRALGLVNAHAVRQRWRVAAASHSFPAIHATVQISGSTTYQELVDE